MRNNSERGLYGYFDILKEIYMQQMCQLPLSTGEQKVHPKRRVKEKPRQIQLNEEMSAFYKYTSGCTYEGRGRVICYFMLVQEKVGINWLYVKLDQK